VIGRDRFAKISAVEGIKPPAAMKKPVAQFDRDGLSAAERRREIIRVHKITAPIYDAIEDPYCYAGTTVLQNRLAAEQ
jgi:hypothetical protein